MSKSFDLFKLLGFVILVGISAAVIWFIAGRLKWEEFVFFGVYVGFCVGLRFLTILPLDKNNREFLPSLGWNIFKAFDLFKLFGFGILVGMSSAVISFFAFRLNWEEFVFFGVYVGFCLTLRELTVLLRDKKNSELK